MSPNLRVSPLAIIIVVLAAGFAIVRSKSEPPRDATNSPVRLVEGYASLTTDSVQSPAELPSQDAPPSAEPRPAVTFADLNSAADPPLADLPLLAQIDSLLLADEDPLVTYDKILAVLAGAERPSSITEPDPLLKMFMVAPAKLAQRMRDHPEYFDIARVDMSSAGSSAAMSFAVYLVREGVRLGVIEGVAPDLWRAYASTDNYHIHKSIVVNLHTWGQDSSLIDLAFEEAYFSRLPDFMPERWTAQLGGSTVELTRAEQVTPNYPGLDNALDGSERYLRKWPADLQARNRFVRHMLDIARDPKLDPRELDSILQHAQRATPEFIGSLRQLRPQYIDSDTAAVLANPVWD